MITHPTSYSLNDSSNHFSFKFVPLLTYFIHQITSLIAEINAAIENSESKSVIDEKVTKLEALSGKAFTDAYNSRAKSA